MRRAGKIGMVGAAGFNALVVGSMLLAQGRPAEAQRVGSESAGDAPVVPRTSAIAGPGDKLAADSMQESRMLLAHGLEMTIEGSTLQGMAMRAAGVGLGPAVDPRPSPAGVVGSSSVGTVVVPRPVVAVPAPTTAGTGFTGAPGETVSGRPVGNGNEITPRTPVAGLPDAPQPGGVDQTIVNSGVPLSSGQAAAMLRRQALRSFESGERLINQGSIATGPDGRLQQAATRYANTLRTFASQPILRFGVPAAGTTVVTPGGAVAVATTPAATTVNTPIGSVTVATAPAVPVTASAATVGADPASVALINHAVKEAIGAMKIRSIIRNMGGSSGPAGQQLMDHAMMMESESRNTIRAFAGIGDSGPVARADGELGSPNGSVQTLAQQANDLILALLGLPAAESGGPAR
jgi:hypothetical protein